MVSYGSWQNQQNVSSCSGSSLSLTSCLSAEHISIILLSCVKFGPHSSDSVCDAVSWTGAGPVQVPGLSRCQACPGAGPVQVPGLSRCQACPGAAVVWRHVGMNPDDSASSCSRLFPTHKHRACQDPSEMSLHGSEQHRLRAEQTEGIVPEQSYRTHTVLLHHHSTNWSVGRTLFSPDVFTLISQSAVLRQEVLMVHEMF